LHSDCRIDGADPTALKCTVTLGLGKSPAELRALAASRGSEVRIIEEARVSGRSGEVVRSGICDGSGVWEGEGEVDMMGEEGWCCSWKNRAVC